MNIFDKITCRLCKQFKLCNKTWTDGRIIEKYQVKFWYIDNLEYHIHPSKFYSKHSAEKFAAEYLQDFNDVFNKWELVNV